MKRRRGPAQTDILIVRTIPEVQLVAHALKHAFQRSASEACDLALSIVGRGEARDSARSLRAGYLVDCGTILGSRDAVEDAVKTFAQLVAETKSDPALRYNLANALMTLANLTGDRSSPDWYNATGSTRRKARGHLSAVTADTSADDGRPGLRSNAAVNLGNDLDTSYRWVEAYDSWVAGLQLDRSNAVAALCITEMLDRRGRQFRHHPSVLHSVRNHFASEARRGASTIAQRASPGAADSARKLTIEGGVWSPERTPLRPYEAFVEEHRLALVGCIEGARFQSKRWDQLYLHRILDQVAENSVSPVVAMFNQLKADFCAARWLAFLGAGRDAEHPQRRRIVRETATYMDTLDYATYGVRPSLLILAQRSAFDVLDRIAVLSNYYFGVGEKASEVSFREFWRGRDGEWRAELAAELRTARNPGLIALAELAADLGDGSPLESKRSLRNTGTHRFSVLHDDFFLNKWRECDAVDHHDSESFLNETIKTLHLARAAIFYLVDAVEWHAMHRSRGRSFEIPLVPHHRIRGER